MTYGDRVFSRARSRARQLRVLMLLAGMVGTAMSCTAQGAVVDTSAYNHPIRVACVGASTTYGATITDIARASFPAQLGALLGAAWDVRNFGVNSAGVIRKGELPYATTDAFRKALAFMPDVVIFNLGVNDTKPRNWRDRGDFLKDYRALAGAFAALASHPKLYMCREIPVFQDRWGIRAKVVTREMYPLKQKLARQLHMPLIDLYTPLKPHPELFTDGIHPDSAGAALMARAVAGALTGKNFFSGPPSSGIAGPKP